MHTKPLLLLHVALAGTVVGFNYPSGQISNFVTRNGHTKLYVLSSNEGKASFPTNETNIYKHRSILVINWSFPTSSFVEERNLDTYLQSNDLRGASRIIKNSAPIINMDKERIVTIFDAVERKTKEAEENNINKRMAEDINMEYTYPPTSPARMEMTIMYQTLKEKGILNVFGAASNGNIPAQGSKAITPTLLERITELSMISLTPQPTNTLLIAGAVTAFAEGILSVYTGINLNFLITMTILFAFLDKLLVNGAIFESITRLIMPEYNKKILRHEAGHFLCAYLLGCPVEGCVLNSWEALADARFGGKRTTVSAGTSFFDPDLSDEINGRKPVSRSSVDRYSIIVMAGIAAEAINFGRADGGAGDEAALITFLSNLNPKSGGAVTWDLQGIKNQARWGALQSVLLLKEYRASYDALVQALEKGGDLGECVFAIENAAIEAGLPSIAQKPLGYIVNQGPYGEWVTTSPESETTNDSLERKEPTNREFNVEEEILSLEELKSRMQKRLKDIDSQLNNMQ